MWTEITKDLVIREAIDSMGYACEETDDFFYVMEYLRYVSCGIIRRDGKLLTPYRRMFCTWSSSRMKSAASARAASGRLKLSANPSTALGRHQATTSGTTKLMYTLTVAAADITRVWV